MDAMKFSIRQTGPGKYRAYVSLGWDPATMRYPQRSKVFRAGGIREAKQVAQIWADSIEDANTTGIDTFGDLATQYLEAKAPGWRPSTFDNVDSMLRAHFLPELADTKIADLGRRTISEWQQHRPGTKNTRRNHYRQMKSILLWAAKTGRMTRDQAANLIDSMEVIGSEEVDAPTIDAVRAALTVARAESPQIYTLIRLAAVGGLRRGELAGLQLCDWDPDTRVLEVRRSFNKRNELADLKTKKSKRRVVVDQATADLLDQQAATVVAYYQTGGMQIRPDPAWPLFISKDGGHLPLSTITHAMARIRKKAGLPKGSVWMHGLRHTTATEMRGLGIDPLVVQGRLGHTNMAMTDRYTDVLPAAEYDAAEAIGARIAAIEG